VGRFEDGIRSVDVEESFRSRPPSNWAVVWPSGEWLRIREGLSPNSVERFDEWLAVFFSDRIDIDKGFYHEPGHPNSYDLFTRFHLADILQEGYGGRFWGRDVRVDGDRSGVQPGGAALRWLGGLCLPEHGTHLDSGRGMRLFHPRREVLRIERQSQRPSRQRKDSY